MSTCPDCGKQIVNEEHRFCENCGAALPREAAGGTAVAKNPLAAIVTVVLAAAALFVGAVVILMVKGSGDSGSGTPTGSTTASASGAARTGAAGDAGAAGTALQEPFTLRVDIMDGNFDQNWAGSADRLMHDIELKVENGRVAGKASTPFVSGDGTTVPGKFRTLEIEGTYAAGVLNGTWVYLAPAGVADVRAEGPIRSEGTLTRESARATITGTISVDPADAGPDQSYAQEKITVLFVVGG